MGQSRLNLFYTLAMIANILTLVVIFLYLLSLMGLDYKRTRALTIPDFSLQTDDYATAKFYFISPIPLFLIMLVPLAFFLRLIPILLFDMIGIYGPTDYMTKKGDLTEDQKDAINEEQQNVKNSFETLRIIHIIVTIIALLALIASFILICIDFGNCNKDPDSLCTNQLFCCSTDIWSAPGISNGCPWIQSCSGVSPSVTSASLDADFYFIFTFIMQLILLVFLAIHLVFGFIKTFTNPTINYSKMETRDDSESVLLEENTNTKPANEKIKSTTTSVKGKIQQQQQQQQIKPLFKIYSTTNN